MYQLRYDKKISNEEALGIINSFLNLINIIKENEPRNNLRKKIY